MHTDIYMHIFTYIDVYIYMTCKPSTCGVLANGFLVDNNKHHKQITATLTATLVPVTYSPHSSLLYVQPLLSFL